MNLLLTLALLSMPSVSDGGAADVAPLKGVESAEVAEGPQTEPSVIFPTIEHIEWSLDGQEAQLLLLRDADRPRALAASNRANAELRRAFDVLAEEKEGGEISALVRAHGEPLPLSPEVFDVLGTALRVAKLSSGAYDPTAAPLLALWGFDGRGRVPEPEPLKAALARVDYQRVRLGKAEQTGTVSPGTTLHLGSVRSGAALERAAEVLQRTGQANFVLRMGGDVVARGSKGSGPWMVGIQDPRGPGYFAAFPALDQAVATVGDYQQFFFRAGARFHDRLDPRSGTPARRSRSATIVAARADEAAALAAAVFVLGPEAGLELVGRLRDVETVIVDSDNRVHISPGLADVVRYRPPTDGV